MAWTWTRTAQTDGTVCVWALRAALIAAGWSSVKDSDGTTYSSAGTQLTGSGSGAHGLANNYAWFVLQAPSVNGCARSFCFQRITNTYAWRIKYSYNAGFTGGSPAGAQVPSATDEKVLQGAGTDAAPTGTACFINNTASIIWTMTGGAAESYCFFTFATAPGAGTVYTGQMMLGLETLAAGSYSASDPDPAIIFNAQNSADFGSNVSAYCGATQGWQTLGVCSPQGGSPGSWVGTSVGDPFTGYDVLLPLSFGRTSAPRLFKGYAAHLYAATLLRATLDTITLNTTRDWMLLGYSSNYSIAFPWDGSVPIY